MCLLSKVAVVKLHCIALNGCRMWVTLCRLAVCGRVGQCLCLHVSVAVHGTGVLRAAIASTLTCFPHTDL